MKRKVSVSILLCVCMAAWIACACAEPAGPRAQRDSARLSFPPLIERYLLPFGKADAPQPEKDRDAVTPPSRDEGARLFTLPMLPGMGVRMDTLPLPATYTLHPLEIR